MRLPDTNMRHRVRDASAKVVSKQIGTTEYGFPSTLNQGKHVKLAKELDRTMENEHLVSKDNYIQSSIKVHRQHMKE